MAGSDGYFILDNTGRNMGFLYWGATGGNGSDAVTVAILTGVTSLAPAYFTIV